MEPPLDPKLTKALILLYQGTEESIGQLKDMLREAIENMEKSKGGDGKSAVADRFAEHLVDVKGDLPPESSLSRSRTEPILFKMTAESGVSTSSSHQVDNDSTIASTNILSLTSLSSESTKPTHSESPRTIEDNQSKCGSCSESTENLKNRFIECQECKEVYHQQCHFPPVSDSEYSQYESNPRFVWYCYKCADSLKHAGSVGVEKASAPSSDKAHMLSSSTANTASKSKRERKPATQLQEINLFKRANKPITPERSAAHGMDSNTKSTSQLTGLASLAAHFSSPEGKKKSGIVSNTSTAGKQDPNAGSSLFGKNIKADSNTRAQQTGSSLSGKGTALNHSKSSSQLGSQSTKGASGKRQLTALELAEKNAKRLKLMKQKASDKYTERKSGAMFR